MKQYKSHKTVEAAKIIAWQRTSHGKVHFEIDGGENGNDVLELSAEVIARGEPACGDYLKYSDDYYSWSPASAFEDGYTAIEPEFGARSQAAEKGRLLSDEASKLASDRLKVVDINTKKPEPEPDIPVTLNSRIAMAQICKEAGEFVQPGMNPLWALAWQDLARAADRLDLMMLRTEVVEDINRSEGRPNNDGADEFKTVWIPTIQDGSGEIYMLADPARFGGGMKTSHIDEAVQCDEVSMCKVICNAENDVRRKTNGGEYYAESYRVTPDGSELPNNIGGNAAE